MPKKAVPSDADRVSATQASRTFFALLDKVQAGRRILVHRRGQDVCMLAPPSVRGRRAADCLELLRRRRRVLLDSHFGADLRQILTEEVVEDPPPWDS